VDDIFGTHRQDRDLLDQVWRRLADAALLERKDLRESLARCAAARAGTPARCRPTLRPVSR